MWLGELIAALVVIGLGGSVILFSWHLPYYTEFGPGPGFLPQILGYVITICGIIILIKVLRKQDRSGGFFKPGTVTGVKLLALIIVAFLLFPALGFSVGLGLFTGTTMRVMGKHHWVRCGVTALVTAIGIHYVFGQWLSIPVPTGMIGW